MDDLIQEGDLSEMQWKKGEALKMKNKSFKRAATLAKEIEELENFLYHPGWKHDLFGVTKPKLRSPINRNIGYSFETYTLSSTLRKRIRKILQEHLNEMKKQFDEL